MKSLEVEPERVNSKKEGGKSNDLLHPNRPHEWPHREMQSGWRVSTSLNVMVAAE
jgi:hypothetical protein